MLKNAPLFKSTHKHQVQPGHSHLSASAFCERPSNQRNVLLAKPGASLFLWLFPVVEEGRLIFPLRDGDLLFHSVSAPPRSSGVGSQCQLLLHLQHHPSAGEEDLLTRDGLMPMLSAAWNARVRFRT